MSHNVKPRRLTAAGGRRAATSGCGNTSGSAADIPTFDCEDSNSWKGSNSVGFDRDPGM